VPFILAGAVILWIVQASRRSAENRRQQQRNAELGDRSTEDW
jgi:hypothetical protein